MRLQRNNPLNSKREFSNERLNTPPKNINEKKYKDLQNFYNDKPSPKEIDFLLNEIHSKKIIDVKTSKEENM